MALNIGNLPDLERRAARPRTASGTAVAPRTYGHLRPAPSFAAAPAPAAPSSFAERVMAADAAARGERFDAAKVANGPVQRRVVATGADILAAHKAAHEVA